MCAFIVLAAACARIIAGSSASARIARLLAVAFVTAAAAAIAVAVFALV